MQEFVLAIEVFLGSDVLTIGRLVTDVSEDRAAFTFSKKAWASLKMEEAVVA
jgi:hypothetical protein